MSQKKPYLDHTVLEVKIGDVVFSYIYPSTLRTREVYKLTNAQKKRLVLIPDVFLSSITLDIPATKEAIREAERWLGTFKIIRKAVR
jgi:hypothetical protein